VLLMDETRHSLFLKAELESNSLAAVGRLKQLSSNL